MLAYIEENIRFVEDYCREHIPGIRPLRPQASFLVWLNCRDLHLSHDALLDLFIDKAHLALNDGEMFGPGGEGPNISPSFNARCALSMNRSRSAS